MKEVKEMFINKVSIQIGKEICTYVTYVTICVLFLAEKTRNWGVS